MLSYVKKFGTIIIIAILFTAFAFSIVDLIVESPDYGDICPMRPKALPRNINEDCQQLEVPASFEESCYARNGYIEYTYDNEGCQESYECNTCHAEYSAAQKQHRKVGFYVTGILGVMAIIAGLYVRSKEEVIEWVFSGLLIGGIISIFIGTIMYFGDMDRFTRPVVLLVEMGLIIWIAIKTTRKE
jgi:hypothetical protein